MDWYLTALKDYAGFSGRSRRKEFWTFTLVNWLVVGVLGLADGILCIVPLVGQILLLLYLVLDSERGANHYGPDPKPAG